MTTLISWKANDSRGITSIYLASDSRYTWKESKWDFGQKVYACTKFPEIIGYCGDVLLSISIISSMIELIDNEIIYKNIISSDEKNKLIYKYIKEKFKLFPKSVDTTIIHIIKDVNKKFSYYEIKYSCKSRKWSNTKKQDIEKKESELIDAYGSGAKEYMDRLIKNRQCELDKTSRFYYMIFCDLLKDMNDKYTGGAPQIVGLYKGKNTAISNGTIWGGERFLYGTKIGNELNVDNIEWRSENFERYEPFKNMLVKGAKKQPKYRQRKKPL